MTSNDLIVCYFIEFDSFGGRFTVVEDRRIMSAVQTIVFHFWRKLPWPTLQRGLSVIAELLVMYHPQPKCFSIFYRVMFKMAWEILRWLRELPE